MPTTRILISWRDIPSQIVTKRGRNRGKVLLSLRFQNAIDRAAMRAGKGGSEAYIEEWRREPSSLHDDGDLQDIASAQAQQIESSYSDEQLLQLIKNHGRIEV